MTDHQVDVNTPSSARVYDYLLGGHDNFPVDRAAAAAILAITPDVGKLARYNRDFLGRAVREAAAAGIDQFLDIGSGLPTQGNVHEIAQAVNPAAHVVYVDSDPLTHNHAVALLKGHERAAFVHGDARKPDAILNHPETRRLLDLDRPVAILMVALLHFVPDSDDPLGITRELMAAATSGSRLVLSHMTTEDMPADLAAALDRVYGGSAAAMQPRTRADIEGFFDGLELADGRLDDVQAWHHPTPPPLEAMRLLCGVGIKG